MKSRVNFRTNTRAREGRADFYADQIIDIADEVEGTEDNTAVNAARLRIDARKWKAARMAPKKWGDRIQQDVNANVQVDMVSPLVAARKRLEEGRKK